MSSPSPAAAKPAGLHLAHLRLAEAPALDPPAPVQELTVRRLALYAHEVIEGMRSIEQLSGWITPEVALHLAERRRTRLARRSAYRDPRRLVLTPGRAHIDQSVPGVLESTVVLHSDRRSLSVAIRFDYSLDDERWRVTDLTVL